MTLLARVLLALVAAVATAAADDPLAPGQRLDRTNAGAAAQLLPPEMLAHYERGTFANTIARWPAVPQWDAAFAGASEANASRFDVDGRGTIVDREGRPARGLYGLPFRIDGSDPRAGVKVVWNAYYAFWRTGSSHDVFALDWLNPSGLERQATLESWTIFHEGAPPARAAPAPVEGLASAQYALVTAPADLHGTAVLSRRFQSAERPDQTWTYVPAMRRVRQISPTNRSDGFLGSDLTVDDGGPGFGGKPEDFTWKLIGAREALVLADPRSLDGTSPRRGLPDGGVVERWPPDQKTVGYQDPAWTGAPWGPIGAVLVRRPVWVVEAKPRDRFYVFDRLEFWIDRETFQGAMIRKADRTGKIVRSVLFLTAASQPIEAGGESVVIPAGSMALICAENLDASRATTLGASPPSGSVHERRAHIDPGLFAYERLTSGK